MLRIDHLVAKPFGKAIRVGDVVSPSSANLRATVSPNDAGGSVLADPRLAFSNGSGRGTASLPVIHFRWSARSRARPSRWSWRLREFFRDGRSLQDAAAHKWPSLSAQVFSVLFLWYFGALRRRSNSLLSAASA